ncbi:MAG: class II fructose-bisphosphate aldolase, partial [Armatimonadota bacterium]
MALRALSELLNRAAAGGYAVGYFEAWDLYSFEAVALAAEAEQSPVVLGFGGMMMDQGWLDRYGIEPLGAYGRVVAEGLGVPVALILNEVWEWDHAARGVGAGFNTVMLNTCELPYERNLELTARLVEFAHPRGVEVQAELGRLPNFGDNEPGELTDPMRAREFVAATAVDCLAVSVGNMHLRTDGTADIDFGRLRAIREQTAVPLVIHGGSGLSAPSISELIHGGVTLFHVGTIMKKRTWEATAAALKTLDGPPDFQARVGSRKPDDLLMPARTAVTDTVRA